jgi:basic amino acid/polyamine antiporter, APA family
MASDSGTARSSIFAVRSVQSLLGETEEAGHHLKRTVSVTQLTALGIGAIVGTGIFVVVGEGAALAGPAMILSFIIAAIACAFSALSYAELASSIPVSGSAYTYSYATLGEVIAWIIGWDLLLEYGLASAAVAVGWAANLDVFLETSFGIDIPQAVAASPEGGGVFNLPAVLIVAAITVLLVRGAKESTTANMVLVVVKLVALLFFIVIAASQFSTANFTPFAPHGADGVISGAALIFFAFLGFDAVATGGEEARNPSRDLPIAIIGSLVIATVFYVLVAIGAIGIATPAQLAESEAPLSAALEEGAGITWAAAALSVGAVIALTSVLLVLIYAQTRILFAMCRDGLLPEGLASVNARYGTPAKLTLGLGAFIALFAAFVPLANIVQLVNVGTLFAFIVVNIGVIILRRTRPEMPRPYRVPFSPVVPLIGTAMAIYLMTDLPLGTWIRFIIWLAIGALIYATYGYRNSRVRAAHGEYGVLPAEPADVLHRHDSRD